MCDICYEKNQGILSYEKRLQELQRGLDNYIPKSTDDIFNTLDVYVHILYVKYMVQKCRSTFLEYLVDSDDDNNLFHYKLLSGWEKKIAVEFDEAIKKYEKLEVSK